MKAIEKPTADRQKLLFSVVENAIQQRHGEGGKLKNLTTEKLEGNGHSGNEFHAAKADWTDGEEHQSRLILKRWRPDGATAALMGHTVPTESLVRISRLFARMSEDIFVPIVGSYPDKSGGVWIVMDDVTTELGTTKHIATDDGTKPLLNLLAKALAKWSTMFELADLDELPWLLPQERRLWCNASLYRIALDLEPISHAPSDKGQRHFLKNNPSMSKRLQESAKVFISALPKKYREFWRHHMVDRSELQNRFADFPRSLIHGDVVPDNIGLCHDREKLVMIDWEWLGVGTPAFDAHHFLREYMHQFAQLVPDAEARQEPLRNYFYDRYIENGGTGYTAELWEDAWDAVLVWDSLTWCPIIVGNAVKHGRADAKLLNSKIETLTTIAMRVLN